MKIWRFQGYTKFQLHLRSFQMNSGAGAQWGQQNVTKITDQGNQILGSWVRAQNRGKICNFGCDTFLTKVCTVIITLNISKNHEIWGFGSKFIIFQTRDPTISINYELQVTSTLSGGIISFKSTNGQHLMVVNWNP